VIKPVPPPLGAKMVDEQGFVTSVWGSFFSTLYRYEQANFLSVADGTYTVGLGSTPGEITIQDGVVTDIQEVVS